ncbi:MAG: hypothetical protein RLZZ234_555 [Candidatus Parcubacteria bacterium]|jgi:hypothetical protein
MHNAAFDMTEEDSKRYLGWVVKESSRTIQKLFFDCMRVARRIKIMLPYRTFLAGFFKWLHRNRGGTVQQFLLAATVREVFARGMQVLRYHRLVQEHFWRTAPNSTLQ